MLSTQRIALYVGALFVLFSQTRVSSDAALLNFGNYIGRIWHDGSGVIGKPSDVEGFKDTWSFRIKTDEMTDEKVITADRYAYTNSREFGKLKLNYDIWLWLNFSKKDQEMLCIAGHDYPGKRGMIRIDKNRPITTNENRCVRLSKDLDTQLRKEGQITLRGYHWPYGGGETKTISLGGYIALSGFLRSKR